MRRLVPIVLVAVLLAAGWLLAVGILTIRADLLQIGAVGVGWDNQVEEVGEPSAPWWHYSVIGLLAAVVFYVCVRGVAARWRHLGLALLVGSATLCVCAAWALSVTAFEADPSIVGSAQGVATDEAPVIAWLREGGLSPATFAMIGGLLALALASRTGSRPANREAGRTADSGEILS